MSSEPDRDGVDSSTEHPAGDGDTRVRLRGIYATALTELLDGEFAVVRASDTIRERFDGRFPIREQDVDVTTTSDRQGVGILGQPDAVSAVAGPLRRVSRDALEWLDVAPRGAIFEGVVTDTLGSGAVVALGNREGFLPYDAVEDYVNDGDVLRVQVVDPSPQWAENRPELTTDLRVEGGLVTLRRGSPGAVADETARLAELLPVDPPDGWTPRWDAAADDADLDTLAEALSRAVDRTEALMASVADAETDDAPERLFGGDATRWVWFGRESRFALDARRRAVTTTMPGHHRIKAAADRASAAVDFAEAVCESPGWTSSDGVVGDTNGGGLAGDAAGGGAAGDAAGGGAAGDVGGGNDQGGSPTVEDFPFGVTTRQFGPREGGRIAIAHGKPDGRLLVLGRGEVTALDPAGTVTLRREMSAGGTYDALEVERRTGDVAITKLGEGRWWYATVYRGEDGERRGTYVNVCTPVEVFPSAVRYVDLHVDVVKHPDGMVERVDDDELDEAVAAGNVSEDLAEKARSVAARIETVLEDRE